MFLEEPIILFRAICSYTTLSFFAPLFIVSGFQPITRQSKKTLVHFLVIKFAFCSFPGRNAARKQGDRIMRMFNHPKCGPIFIHNFVRGKKSVRKISATSVIFTKLAQVNCCLK
jgi:hypothetical protein